LALSDEDLRTLAAEILARDEYSRWRAPKFELASWFIDQLTRFLAWLDQLSAESPWLYALVLFSLSALVLLLLAHIVWSIRSALAAPVVQRTSRRVSERPLFAEEALAFAREGRYLEAAHRLHLASLELLLRDGMIELARHEPNSTLCERIARSALSPDLRSDLIHSLDALQARWFRDRRADSELYESWRALHARLTQAGNAA
jgi:hypothetical protein